MKPHWTTLFSSEDRFIPAIDVSVGPINGAARKPLNDQGCLLALGANRRSPGNGQKVAAAAAPPEPTYVPGVGFLPRHEPTPADFVAWVPWHGGECPVPAGQKSVWVRTETGFEAEIGDHETSACAKHWRHEPGEQHIIAYRLANPTPRGPCTLPPDHPHAALERLYMSDDTLKCWLRMGRAKVWYLKPQPDWTGTRYHIGHVGPEGV